MLSDPKVVYQYRGGKGPVHLYNVLCVGNEPNLLECTHIKQEEQAHPHCVHAFDIGVSCGKLQHITGFNMLLYIVSFSLAPPCSEGEVRLLLDRVQTCHNEIWGYVCIEHGWSCDEAAVVCGELGFPPEGWP